VSGKVLSFGGFFYEVESVASSVSGLKRHPPDTNRPKKTTKQEGNEKGIFVLVRIYSRIHTVHWQEEQQQKQQQQQ
jgi:hypothetical protein